MNGKVIGYMKEPCKECQEMMKQGFLLIGVIGKLTEDENITAQEAAMKIAQKRMDDIANIKSRL
jgi:hypothetical protein